MITDGLTGHLIRTGDVANFAEKLAVLLSDSKKLSWLGVNGRETTLRRFSEHVVGPELRKLYQTLVSHAKGLARTDSDSSDKRAFECAVQQTIRAAMVKGYRSVEEKCDALFQQKIELLKDVEKLHGWLIAARKEAEDRSKDAFERLRVIEQLSDDFRRACAERDELRERATVPGLSKYLSKRLVSGIKAKFSSPHLWFRIG